MPSSDAHLGRDSRIDSGGEWELLSGWLNRESSLFFCRVEHLEIG